MYMTFMSVHLKTNPYIAEILLKVALSTITLAQIRKNTDVPNNPNNRKGETFKQLILKYRSSK